MDGPVAGKTSESSNPSSMNPRLFYNVFVFVILSHCSRTLINANSSPSIVAKGYVFSFAQLSPSNKYFFLNTEILIIFPF